MSLKEFQHQILKKLKMSSDWEIDKLIKEHYIIAIKTKQFHTLIEETVRQYIQSR